MAKLMILNGHRIARMCCSRSDCCCFGSLLLQEEPEEGKKDPTKATGKGETWREARIIVEVVLGFEFFFG
jgi:hypothetical protein